MAATIAKSPCNLSIFLVPHKPVIQTHSLPYPMGRFQFLNPQLWKQIQIQTTAPLHLCNIIGTMPPKVLCRYVGSGGHAVAAASNWTTAKHQVRICKPGR